MSSLDCNQIPKGAGAVLSIRFLQAIVLLLACVSCGRRAVVRGLGSTLEGGGNYWRSNGFMVLEPSIRLPEIPNVPSRTTIFLFVPPDRRIDVHEGQPVLPEGSICDRVEYRKIGDAWVVADVRGTRIGANRTQYFRAYRPQNKNNDEILFGAEWKRVEGESPTEIRAFFREAMLRGEGFLQTESGSNPQKRQASFDRYTHLLRCSSCHQPNTPLARFDEPRHLRGNTDAQGFYSLFDTLLSQRPLEAYRPIDPNAHESLIEYRCHDGSRAEATGRTNLRCEDGTFPQLVFDLRQALRRGDARASALCQSREALWLRMSEAARRQFETSIEECRNET